MRGRSRRLRAPAWLAVAGLVGAGAAVVPFAAGTAGAAGACQVTYNVQSQWSSGFTAAIKITNLGDALSSWTLGFSFPGDQKVTQGWSATWSQSGAAVTAKNAAWNGSLGSNGSVDVGFNGTGSPDGVPTSFTLNGTTCNGPADVTTPPVDTTPPDDPNSPVATTPINPPAAGSWDDKFLTLYKKIKDKNNGYFSPEGVPYHSIETLMVEAPDYGHETTSEAFSYWMWLEAGYGKVTGDWAGFNNAWTVTEKYMIPSNKDQPTNSNYDASKPATYAPEDPDQTKYPAKLDSNVKVGADPIASELKSAYGNADIYGMHWLLDVDNKYGFGRCGDGKTKPAYINTYQRGSSESVWETIPQPSCDTFAFGGKNGYLDLFTGDQSYAKQWKYTDAPDADARAVQAAYWALKWATAQGKQSSISANVTKAAKMGDFLRYSMFDKYFKKIGDCTSPTSCAAGSGKNSEHYLISWYYAWGGAYDTSAGWAWRIGDGASHQGYQNPLAAYALSNVSALTPKSSTAKTDWSTSLTRQLQFLKWLQSAEGAVAGGATNSWDGQYGTPPSSSTKFYGMAYDWQPVWHDPPSNRWFGFQAWGLERLAEYYYETGNAQAKEILDKWVKWALANSTIDANGFTIPDSLTWSGAPDSNFSGTGTPAANTKLHVTVDKTTSTDVGVAGSYAKLLAYYGKKAGDSKASQAAQDMMNALINNFSDSKGVATPEVREDYNRFNDKLVVPSGWTGKMPNGDPIDQSSTFLSIRSWYKQDPQWSKVQAYLDGGEAPSITYHRFWAQCDVATALITLGDLFGSTTG